MANTNTPEIPVRAEPGVDDPRHLEKVRQEIAQAAGVPVNDVTPKEEVAENMANANIQGFLEGVAHTKTEEKSPVIGEGSSGFDEIKEEFNAVMPGERPNSLVRVADNQLGSDLEAQRKADIGYQEEKAA